jgi:hypothetical protein
MSDIKYKSEGCVIEMPHRVERKSARELGKVTDKTVKTLFFPRFSTPPPPLS